ncbi:MAG: succinyl-diaminopimelate desuccinylase [Pseudohongiellaceae bacterium]
MSATLELAKQLIRCRSVTPEDAGCQEILIARLQALGFAIERLPFGDVQNFWAQLGSTSPLLVFAGHTDVVPPGADQDWQSPPFEPREQDGLLFGRGAADMKGSLAAMVTAVENFLRQQQPNGSIGFLITSDEEGDAVNGTVKVVDWLVSIGRQVDYCIVGEPGSDQLLGDTIKIGRRGSLGGRLTVHGIQGHIAYPQLARNPIHQVLPALTALTQKVWDQGNDSFPPTSFQISNIHAGTGASNVIPARLVVDFNFRFSTELDAPELQRQTGLLLDRHGLEYALEWNLSGNPFLTASGKLIEQARKSIQSLTGLETQLSTAGGTSDGRFIAPLTGAQLIELGPCNASIHKVNEHVSIADLDLLARIYQDLMQRLLA